MAKKQYEVLQWASLFLEENNREARVAELLLQHHLNLSRTDFIMNMREIVPNEVFTSFKKDIESHVKTGVPIQHLMGYEEFYGRRFKVNEHVLIPRPETEELVQHTIDYVRAHKEQSMKLVDVGTGSGVIAITLALEIPNLHVFATDISKEALQVAEENALGLGADITFLEGDFLHPPTSQQESVDILVSNPPYIAERERVELSDTVKNFDPELALFAADEGLRAYRDIIQQATSLPRKPKLTAFEIGHTQGNAVSDLIRESFPQSQVEIVQDINKKDRMVIAKLN